MGELFSRIRRSNSTTNDDDAATTNTTERNDIPPNPDATTAATTDVTTESNDIPPQPDVTIEEEAKPADTTTTVETKIDSNENETGRDDAVTTTVNDSVDEVKQPDAQVVTRYEIREMSSELQNRFFDAVDTMMKNKNGPGTSEFFRCAAYHGSPPPIYCQHGRETFPGWHRIYLLDFENALRAADRENGNDGDIGLPYWDWTTNPQDGLPSIVRQRFSQWPNDLFPSNVNAPSLTRNNDSQIAQMIQSWNVIGDAQDSLLSTQHFAHASTGGEWASSYPSLESPHNSMHVIVGGNGGPMASVAWAAFDIAFWLHHCNVDRIYESYLSIEPDSRDEFEWTQQQQGTNLFAQEFDPFKKDSGDGYFPEDTFDPRKLGFVYNKLFPVPGLQQLRLAPTVALFASVKVNEFESKCYQIHVYVINSNEEEKFSEPQTMNDINFESPNYAGGTGIFGRGMECENCASRPPYDLIVDITKTLTKLQISRYDAKLKVYCLETTEQSLDLIPLSDTPLPEPIITGPLFESQTDPLKQESRDEQNKNEVEGLQRYLRRYGYYDDEIDGLYGPNTVKAVTAFQTATGYLEKDGWVGENTKKAIRHLRRCSNKDPFVENKIEDEFVSSEFDGYKNKDEITYSIGISPSYVSRRATVQCINKAFELWSNALGDTVNFKPVEREHSDNANINITWSTASMRDGHLMRFDGPGGVLGHGGRGTGNFANKGYVVFDISERWVIHMETEFNKNEKPPSDLHDPKTWHRGQPTISLYHTAVHEIGHALGLVHSEIVKDIMSPFYDPTKTQLSENDIANVRREFGIEN